MASTTFSIEDAKKSILEEGFFDLNDSVVGKPIQEMEQEGFPFFTEYGLDFCKKYVLDDTRIKDVLEFFFEKRNRCILGHWLRYKRYPNHIVCFRKGGPNAGRGTLLVHLWAEGSQVDYYGGSHLHDLPVEEGERSLYEILPSALVEVGCKATPKKFKEGGLVVLDSRIGYEIKEGYVIAFEFATEDLIKSWKKMILPDSRTLRDKVTNMGSERIGINFVFEGSGRT